MATLNFDESIILILFAQTNGAAKSPMPAEIVNFDAQQQKDFGDLLQEIMKEEGLAIDVHNRSLVLGLAPHMGGMTARPQFRHACRYILAAKQELVAAPGAGAATAAAASGARAARASRTRKSASRRRARGGAGRSGSSARRRSNR